MTDTYTVALAGAEGQAWLVDAPSPIAAVAEVRERTDKGRMTPDGNWYVWPAGNACAPQALGIAAPTRWTRL